MHRRGATALDWRVYDVQQNARVVLRLGEPELELVECRGISLLWLFHRWTRLMEVLPRPLAWSTMTVMDRIAYRMPAIADVLVSVWRPRRDGDGRG